MELQCSKCKVEKPTSEFNKKPGNRGYQYYCKRCLYDAQMLRWLIRKKEAVKLLGGECSKCGYDKNYAAFEFHHLDPNEKEFEWTKIRQLSWSKAVAELQKCVLLCANCHRETHFPEATFNNLGEGRVNHLLQDKTMKPTSKCADCGLSVYGTKFCSKECAAESKRKVQRPTKDELELLLKTNSWCKIGRTFGVSDNAVRKWARQYQIAT